MKNLYKYIVAALIVMLASETTLSVAQEVQIYYRGNKVYQAREDGGLVEYRTVGYRKINWLENNGQSRYVIALNPMYLFDNGLRADFEMELNKPGRWLQFGLTGYNRRHNEYADYNGYSGYGGWYYEDGWRSRNSGYQKYTRLRGVGLSVGYKEMFTEGGWYYQAAGAFSYYNVWDSQYRLCSYQENGLTFYEYGSGKNVTDFYVPSINFNLGKHMAVSRSVFFDMYIGLGYSWSIYKDSRDFPLYDNSSYGFGYSGLYFSAGIRLGVLLNSRR